VVHGDTADAVDVTPASQSYGDLERLPAGVSAGTKVIDKPPKNLTDGMRVKLAESSS